MRHKVTAFHISLLQYFVKLLSNKPANLLTKYEIQQIQTKASSINHQIMKNQSNYLFMLALFTPIRIFLRAAVHKFFLCLYCIHMYMLYTCYSLFMCRHMYWRKWEREKDIHEEEREYALPGCWLWDCSSCFGVLLGYNYLISLISLFRYFHSCGNNRFIHLSQSKSDKEKNVKWQI
jgi:hypothetical protein